tara:strand:- start:442 stop:558 length:117 start_codon:yes stop_codon:yes gene_type:complete
LLVVALQALLPGLEEALAVTEILTVPKHLEQTHLQNQP